MKNDGTTIFKSSGTVCAGTETQYRGCIPGFLIKAFYIYGKTSCTNLTIQDSSNAFNWVCVIADNGTAAAVSYSLKDGKGLGHMIDFTNLTFKDMYVTVYDGGDLFLKTSASKWWNNQIVAITTTSNTPTSGQILVHSTNIGLVNGAARIIINTPKVSVVTNPDAKVLISYSVGVPNSMIEVTVPTNFHWIEANLSGANINTGAFSVVDLISTNYSEVRNSRISNGYFANVRGLKLNNSNNNVIQNVFVGNNDVAGLTFFGTSKNNLILGLSSFNNRNGIDANGQSPFSNIIIGGTILNSNVMGLNFFGAGARYNQTFLGLDIANTSGNGMNFGGTAGILLTHTASVNNSTNELVFSPNTMAGQQNTILHSAFISNTTSIDTSAQANANREYFVGYLKRDAHCAAGGVSGISGTSCSSVIPSDFTQQTISSPYGIFRGKVSDSSNLSANSSGQATHSPNNDWYLFENIYRGWGIGNSYVAHKWESTGGTDNTTCSNVVFPGSFYYAGACYSVFLREAVEIIGDYTGNENGLCESNEYCLYTPNIGAYQGHGTLKSASSVSGCADIGTGGTVYNVVLFQYETNGY